MPLFELLVENSKHPNFEWRGGGEAWILLFSEVTLFGLLYRLNFNLLKTTPSGSPMGVSLGFGLGDTRYEEKL